MDTLICCTFLMLRRSTNFLQDNISTSCSCVCVWLVSYSPSTTSLFTLYEKKEQPSKNKSVTSLPTSR
jgi:hypothetical protein